jgi:hypothetical protein
MIKQRAEPPRPDYEAIAEKTRRTETHARLTATVSDWQNTIASNRIDRQTRLQRQAAAEEERKLAIDREEKRFQKLQRQAKLAEASRTGFAQRPEVRNVNAQLLLHEVQMERDQQVATRNIKRLNEQRKQIALDDEYHQHYLELCEQERQIRFAERQKALAVAQDVRQQKIDKEAEKARVRAEEKADDRRLAEFNDWELWQEKVQQEEAVRKARQHNIDVRLANDEMMRYKESLTAIDDEEERRERRLREQIMDEQDARAAAELKLRNDKLAARQKVIDAEAQRQIATRVIQQDFLERQLDLQHEKESNEINELLATRNRLAEERRQDFLDAVKATEKRRLQKEEREAHQAVYPWTGDQEENERVEQRTMAFRKMSKDLQEFQRNQARDKRNKDLAERERQKLEFKHTVEQDQAFLQRAQNYACELLANADRDDSDLKYYTD